MRILAISSPTPQATPEALSADMDAEIANGRRLYEEGFLVEGYMDPTYSTAYFLVEAESVEAAQEQLGSYPQVRAGLTTYTCVPLVGLPAIEQSVRAAGRELPAWWPPGP